MKNLKIAYFSPTGTTATVCTEIARGISEKVAELHNLNTPKNRSRPLSATAEDTLILAVPVYMGRVPALLGDWLDKLRLERTPVVCVVVYGNRAYEDALLELSDIAKERGGIPVAGAAFIGEHSFSTTDLPTAHGRPDTEDLKYAFEFGRKIRTKLEHLRSTNQNFDLSLPGNRPYGGITKLWDVDFIAIGEQCTQCGMCAEFCPTNAIAAEDCKIIDIEKCISCCACIKKCPENARSMKTGPVKDAAQRLNNLFSSKKEPEIFI